MQSDFVNPIVKDKNLYTTLHWIKRIIDLYEVLRLKIEAPLLKYKLKNQIQFNTSINMRLK